MLPKLGILIKKLNGILAISLYPFVLDIEMQKKIINQYSNPKDLLERSYFQFKVQFDLVPTYKRWLNNAAGFMALFYFLLLGIVGRYHKIITVKKSAKKSAIFPYKNYNYSHDVLPTEVKEVFTVMEIDFMKNFYLNSKDFRLIFKIISSHPFQFYFISKCVSKILFYRYIIEKYHPDAIISSSEYSFSSSVGTLFCRKNNISHINIMHGEKFYLIKDSFFEYDKFYVWDNFYKELFLKLKAEPTQFIIGTFNHLKMNLDNDKIEYNYTYYLARENEESLIKIKNSLEKLDQNKNICIRFHPRYSSEERIRHIFKDFAIENPVNVTLEQSFSKTKSIISFFSSCLTQGYFNNKNLVIDDYNNPPGKVKMLKDSDYIIFSKKHQLLSTLLTSNK